MSLILFQRYLIMLKCWAKDPDRRPAFAELVIILSSSLSSKAGYLDFAGLSNHTISPLTLEPRLSVQCILDQDRTAGRSMEALWSAKTRFLSQNLYTSHSLDALQTL